MGTAKDFNFMRLRSFLKYPFQKYRYAEKPFEQLAAVS